MYPLPDPPAEDERVSREGEEDPLYRFIVGFVGTATVTYIIGLVMLRLWREEELRLKGMHATMTFLQSIARFFGGWALHVESQYNEYVNLLH